VSGDLRSTSSLRSISSTSSTGDVTPTPSMQSRPSARHFATLVCALIVSLATSPQGLSQRLHVRHSVATLFGSTVSPWLHHCRCHGRACGCGRNRRPGEARRCGGSTLPPTNATDDIARKPATVVWACVESRFC